MQKLKTIFGALVGYAGSSENPNQTSLRFMGIITGVMSQFAPLISLVVVHTTNFCTAGVDVCITQFTGVIQPLVLAVACGMWIVGAIRAMVNTPTVAGFLKK